VSVGTGFVVVYRWLTRPAHDRTWPSQSAIFFSGSMLNLTWLLRMMR
jgi:hypothetical protein